MDDRNPAGRSLTFLGHSTVRIALDGATILTDPVTRGRIGPLIWHGPLAPHGQLLVDVVAISHAHHDHLDLPSLRRLPGDPLFIVPAGLGILLSRRGLKRIHEVHTGDVLSFGGVTMTVVPAAHHGGRLPGGPVFEALGFVVEDSLARIYFAGDTDLFDAMADLGRIDAALLPISGWGPRLGSGHLDPGRAAQAVELIRPPLAVPIHWGTLWPMGLGWLAPSRRDQPAHEFSEAVRARTPEVRVAILRPGERIRLIERQGPPARGPGDEKPRAGDGSA